MNNSQFFTRLFFFSLFFFSWLPEGWSASWYKSEIVYQQAVSKILGRGDISWGSKTDDYYRFGSVVVSADGSKVLFTGKCEYCKPAEVRPFLVNSDGVDIKDLSEMFPSDITNRWSAWRNMLINYDGSRVFFRAVVERGYYDDEYLYVHDVKSSTTQLAVSMDEGFNPFGSAWRFRIDKTGDRIYLDKYDAGWDEALNKTRRGLFYAATGSSRQWYFDVDDLPCASYCGYLNMFVLLGVSAQNDRAFFLWNSDYSQTDGKNEHTALYYTDLNGNPTMLSDEHYTIYEGDWRGISDTRGSMVIYRFKHESGAPQKLALVDVASKESREVAWTSGLNGFDAHLSPSGNYILVNGEYGDHGTYYQTLLNLESGTSRDTWSYHMMSRWGATSNVTEDDRYYFYSIDDTEANSGLYRIDTRTTGDDKAPHVHSIEFSAPALLDQEEVTISVQVTVGDSQGRDNIDWVTLLPLKEGQEKPPWSMGREPIAFPSGDPGSTRLYDDGTHGDALAHDGIYTFDSIATRKGNRDGDSWNTWYQHYTLPADLGIRVVVKDLDNNYTIADTTLRITDNPEDIPDSQEGVCAEIAGDLGLYIPCAVYTGSSKTLSLWLDFDYAGKTEGGDYVWKLGQLGESKEMADLQCPTISDNLNLHVPCAAWESISLWLSFIYAGLDMADDPIWRLENLGEVQ